MASVRADLPVATESAEQQQLFTWAAYQAAIHPELRLMYHIPNEGQRSRGTGGRMVGEGLKKGVPDICLPVSRGGYHGLYIEMKRTKGGKLTPEQAEWLSALEAQGYQAERCDGWEAATKVITEYLSHPPLTVWPENVR